MIARIATLATRLLLLSLLSFTAKAQLTANFTASVTGGCSPVLVRFTDQSTGNPTQWKWDLGNGTISFLQNPSVTYFNPGLYTVKLVVRTASSVDSIVKTQYIQVNAKPTVQFTANRTIGCYPLPVQFTDQSIAGSGTINLWQWDFGDGTSSNQQNPTHVYSAAGNYNVTLRIRNSNDCYNTTTKSQYIRISSGVLANFSSALPSNCGAPASVQFQNLSTGTGNLTYKWSFGDGATSTQLHPSHVYTSLGTYTVQLIVTNATGCTDTIRKRDSIVITNVQAAFTLPDSVCINQPVTFSNASTPEPLSSTWYFGDGTTSTDINPVKTFSTVGSYEVKLISNFGACLDSVIKTIVVNAKPTAAFTADRNNSCNSPFLVNFANQSSGGITFQWSFGDSSFSTLENPSHTYTTSGNFDVQLVVTNGNGCSDTLRKTEFIKILHPVVTLNNLPDSGCAPFSKSFSATIESIDPISGYLWDFGDGSTSTSAEPIHNYIVPGIYSIRLITTTQGGCNDTAVVVRGIIVNTSPTVNFSATPRNTCAKNNVTFTNLSPGVTTSWLWIFGDGGTSTQQNPNHIYTDTGYFDVVLYVWNGGCKDSLKIENYIHIDPPIAKYIEIRNCSRPFEITFRNRSIGADEVLWNFGDGTTSTDRDVVHTYAATGIYPASLTVRNNRTGCDFTLTKNIQILDPKAAFTTPDTVVCKGTPVGFTTGLSATEVKSFSWNFGDDSTLVTSANTVSHIYQRAGRYTVTLIITDVTNCKDTLVRSTYITVFGPTAKFRSSVPGSCLNNAITFNDQSTTDGTHAIQTWAWDYKDGITETLTAPPFQHTFLSAGTYAVKLKVTDIWGCSDSFTLASPIIISKPAAKFITADTLTCPGKTIQFVNQSTGPNLTFTWKFGDGATATIRNPTHQYANNGMYAVTLVVTDRYGCMDSITKINYVRVVTPVASFRMSDSVSTCPPLLVQFTNQSTSSVSGIWDFGDGTSTNTNNPSHFYTYPGTYIAKLTATGPGGCTNITERTIVIKGPRGTFTYNPLIGCNPMQVNFIANTIDMASILWDFNDGATATGPDTSTTHAYTHPGIYVPKMILKDTAGCQVPIRGADTIIVNGALAKFSTNKYIYCDSGLISFNDSSVSNDLITSYTWNFGDGTSSNAQHPNHQYLTPGAYLPTLTITTETGCVSRATLPDTIKIVKSPKANLQTTGNGCTPLTMTMNASLIVADTSAINWSWNFGNGTNSTLQQPGSQVYTVAGVYNVTLTATNSSGCKDSVTKSIEAYLVPTVSAGPDSMICYRRGITLHATGADTYNWSPAIGLSCTNCANPVATPDSIRTYFLKGTTVHGCEARDTVQLKVKYPFDMTVSRRDTLCKGSTKKLVATGAVNYSWTPTAGLDNPRSATPTAQPDTTTNYMVIGTDERSCFSDTGFVFLKVYPIPVVDAGPDKTINVGQTYDLIARVSPDVTIVNWSPTGNIFRNDFTAISVKPTENTEYTVEAKNPGGCLSRDKVTLYVICNGANVFIPNTFSPNGDGANDLFYPRGTGLFKVKNLRIYNRWGELVFEKSSFNANDPSAAWNGTYKGMKLNPDVFVYSIDIICDNNSVLNYKGNVALIQ